MPQRVACSLRRPGPQPQHDRLRYHWWRALAPILPGEIDVPAPPDGLVLLGGTRLPGQAEITDRDHSPPGILRGAVAIGEGVELLDVAERMVGLLLHPSAQAGL